ncbi:MAG: superoxide dismutase [Moorea sp. SIO1G6]|uniref:superoxide dismutase [Cu-Zn] SodC n=1 Tax=Moorena sp. SIO1G6 TaxID=2607840 RepID=UPI0013C03519|nr:superoxide dismutase [Cu-Zn] SodC [Moorena sp. SIO1G6]NET67951.1 superoxide dismutase [Moorena sp. SIO1G6]
MKIISLLAAIAIFIISACSNQSVSTPLTVTMHLTDTKGIGEEIGIVKATETEKGLQLTSNLSGLTPGEHGFHVHAKPNCGPAQKEGKVVPGLAAGGHYDPQNTGKHEGPFGNGHLGDLPRLVFNQQGVANTPVVAPRLKVADLKGHSLIIHAQGDNYSDIPKPLGGGGARAACGVI